MSVVGVTINSPLQCEICGSRMWLWTPSPALSLRGGWGATICSAPCYAVMLLKR